MWKPDPDKNRWCERWAVTAWIALWAMAPGWAYALPTEGEIVSGSGSIEIELTAPQDLTIQQDSQLLITNWQDFSIGSGESVTFNQPNTSAVALNRVIGTDPSLILGNLSADGQVFLTNPSGVLFGKDAMVDVHGLLATTLNISNEDFLNGNYQFNQDPDRSLAAVINNGTLNATRYIGLAAPAVENNGSIIVADLGSVALASGTAMTLDFTGDGLISFAVTGEVTGVVIDADGNVLEDRINNSGLIRANGGQVLLTAKDAGDVIRNVVNHSGIIEARSVQEVDGKIILAGGGSGVVHVSGVLDATGDNEGETGGTLQVTGEKVGLFETARLDVSGHSGGGTALIGGDYQGGGEVPTSLATYVGQDATIQADATVRGDGGTVIVWSDMITRVFGAISARGGAEGGNGGLVETSGKNGLEILTSPDISAPNGTGGTWLIDPVNLNIVAGTNLIDVSESGTTVFTSLNDTTVSELGVNQIEDALLGGGSVEIKTGSSIGGQPGNITWEAGADLDYSDFVSVGPTTSSLTLIAHNDIILNSDITNGTDTDATLNLNIFADSDRSGAGDLIVASGTTIDTNGGAIDFTANDLDIQGTIFGNDIFIL
ncbi:MAG: filamentous hemagglutinin N-terminal domain-containing protein, partial [Nitrospinae bacterium]|nr:filamentous hemagglutinin N-terminal domain-containing protein [Nitrospinota bacterium]